MHEQVPVPANGEAFELVKMRDGLLDDPADAAESDDLLAAPLRDDRGDALGVQPFAEGPGVVAAVGEDGVGPAAWSADAPGDRWYGFDQVLGGFDVGHVPCGGEDREGDAGRVAGDLVFGAGTAAVYR